MNFIQLARLYANMSLINPVSKGAREILILLKDGTLSAGEIGQHFDMSGAAISYHLNQLKKADLIYEKNKRISFSMK